MLNEVDPLIIRVTSDTTICSYDINCAPIPVSFSIEASDDCTDADQMLYTYKIDFEGDGSFDVIHSAIGGNKAEGTWPIGRHIVKWEVEDRCGNTALPSSAAVRPGDVLGSAFITASFIASCLLRLTG